MTKIIKVKILGRTFVIDGSEQFYQESTESYVKEGQAHITNVRRTKGRKSKSKAPSMTICQQRNLNLNLFKHYTKTARVKKHNHKDTICQF